MTDRLPPPPLALLGCDFRVASTAWRSALALSGSERSELSAALREAAGARGLVVLETCNRTEWIVETDQPRWAADLLESWMRRLWSERFPSSEPGSFPTPYRFLEGEAARHLIRVSAGLESFVLGEREVSAQVNRALQSARLEGRATSLLNELGQAAARTVRRVERDCAFRESGRGVHSLAIERLAAHAGCMRRRLRVGIAGLGTIGRRTAGSLEQLGLPPVALFNRSPDPAQGDRRRPLAELPGRTHELDLLIVATGARVPPWRAEELVGERPDGPLLVIDLGSPRQVRPAETDLPGLLLEGLDELLEATSHAAEARDRRLAEDLVERGLAELLKSWRKSPAGGLLRRLQQSRDELGTERLPQLLDEHLGDLSVERRRRLERALRGLVLERDRHLLEHVQAAVLPPEGEPT